MSLSNKAILATVGLIIAFIGIYPFNAQAENLHFKDWIATNGTNIHDVYVATNASSNYPELNVGYVCYPGKNPLSTFNLVAIRKDTTEDGFFNVIKDNDETESIQLQIDNNPVMYAYVKAVDDEVTTLWVGKPDKEKFLRQMLYGNSLKIKLGLTNGKTIYPVFSLKGSKQAMRSVHNQCNNHKSEGFVTPGDNAF